MPVYIICPWRGAFKMKRGKLLMKRFAKPY